MNLKSKITLYATTHIKYIWVLALLIFTTQIIHAQTNPAFIMSSMGNMEGSSNTGMAIQFNSIATCLNVQNGIAVLSGERGSGQFAISCEVSLKINSLGVKIYPNPVSANTRVKFLNTPPLADIFNLSIWSSDGILISTRKETGYNLFQGTEIDLRTLVAGTYILKIESTNYVDAVKFIKAN